MAAKAFPIDLAKPGPEQGAHADLKRDQAQHSDNKHGPPRGGPKQKPRSRKQVQTSNVSKQQNPTSSARAEQGAIQPLLGF